jgi:uncharacterized membrane protein YhiD involved in acid resistance
MELELWILLRLVIAAALSGLIGYERERTRKQAGLRTHMLVAVGAALFVSFTNCSLSPCYRWRRPARQAICAYRSHMVYIFQVPKRDRPAVVPV